MQQLLKASQVATQLQLSLRFIYLLAAAGTIPSVKLGQKKALRFRPADIEDFIKSHVNDPVNS